MAWDVKILSVGKTKEGWLKEALSIYEKRMRGTLSLHYQCVSSDQALRQQLTKERSPIFLDPQGILLTSEKFSEQLIKQISQGSGSVCFVIGGPEGLPKDLTEGNTCWSLSPLTLTHQMVRLLLVEQVYRALEIFKGTSYHK